MHRLAAAFVDGSTMGFSSAFVMCDTFLPFVALRCTTLQNEIVGRAEVVTLLQEQDDEWWVANRRY
jgi:hypothetical protein